MGDSIVSHLKQQDLHDPTLFLMQVVSKTDLALYNHRSRFWLFAVFLLVFARISRASRASRVFCVWMVVYFVVALFECL
jgi:hypothetical protein